MNEHCPSDTRRLNSFIESLSNKGGREMERENVSNYQTTTREKKKENEFYNLTLNVN